MSTSVTNFIRFYPGIRMAGTLRFAMISRLTDRVYMSINDSATLCYFDDRSLYGFEFFSSYIRLTTAIAAGLFTVREVRLCLTIDIAFSTFFFYISFFGFLAICAARLM